MMCYKYIVHTLIRGTDFPLDVDSLIHINALNTSNIEE